MEKIIIGVSGANGSGKDAVCDYISEKYKAKKLVFSDLLKKSLAVFKKDIGRDDYAWLATNLRERFGEGILAKGMRKKIEKAKEQIIIISGVRDFGELKMIHSFEKNCLICVETTIKTRWKRLIKRDSKADDQSSFEDFKNNLEQLPSEKDIKALCEKANYTINNDGTLEELKEKIDKIIKDIIDKE